MMFQYSVGVHAPETPRSYSSHQW